MIFFKKAMLATLVMSAASSVLAANTADLTVTGKITPVACTPNFVGGGTVDYGNINASTLSSSKEVTLAAKDVAYSITCDASIVMATKWIDARRGTAYKSAVVGSEFGLGESGGSKIGSYRILEKSKNLVADGKPAALLSSWNNGAWSPIGVSSLGQVHDATGSERVSFAPSGTTVPGAYSTVSGKLTVEATIAPTSALDLSSDVQLDGLATMEVIYL